MRPANYANLFNAASPKNLVQNNSGSTSHFGISNPSTKVTLSPPINFITSSQNALYKGFVYETEQPSQTGAIRPVMHTGDMVSVLAFEGAILVGLKQANIGHTYLVTGLEYVPDFELFGDGYSMSPATKISRLRLLDPSNPTNRESWYDAEEFFRDYRFGIAFTVNHKKGT